MNYVFTGQTVNEVSPIQIRKARKLGSWLPKGQLKFKEDAGGTGSLIWRDAFTGEQVGSTVSITANGSGSTEALDIPYSYTVELSGAAGGCRVTVGIDGDA